MKFINNIRQHKKIKLIALVVVMILLLDLAVTLYMPYVAQYNNSNIKFEYENVIDNQTNPQKNFLLNKTQTAIDEEALIFPQAQDNNITVNQDTVHISQNETYYSYSFTLRIYDLSGNILRGYSLYVFPVTSERCDYIAYYWSGDTGIINVTGRFTESVVFFIDKSSYYVNDTHLVFFATPPVSLNSYNGSTLDLYLSNYNHALLSFHVDGLDDCYIRYAKYPSDYIYWYYDVLLSHNSTDWCTVMVNKASLHVYLKAVNNNTGYIVYEYISSPETAIYNYNLSDFTRSIRLVFDNIDSSYEFVRYDTELLVANGSHGESNHWFYFSSLTSEYIYVINVPYVNVRSYTIYLKKVGSNSTSYDVYYRFHNNNYTYVDIRNSDYTKYFGGSFSFENLQWPDEQDIDERAYVYFEIYDEYDNKLTDMYSNTFTPIKISAYLPNGTTIIDSQATFLTSFDIALAPIFPNGYSTASITLNIQVYLTDSYSMTASKTLTIKKLWLKLSDNVVVYFSKRYSYHLYFDEARNMLQFATIFYCYLPSYTLIYYDNGLPQTSYISSYDHMNYSLSFGNIGDKDVLTLETYLPYKNILSKITVKKLSSSAIAIDYYLLNNNAKIQKITMGVYISYYISHVLNNTFLVPFYSFTKSGFDQYNFNFAFISDYASQFINTSFTNYDQIVMVSPVTSDFNVSFLYAINKNSTISRYEFMKQISKIVKSSRINKLESTLSTLLLNFAYYQDFLGSLSSYVYSNLSSLLNNLELGDSYYDNSSFELALKTWTEAVQTINELASSLINSLISIQDDVYSRWFNSSSVAPVGLYYDKNTYLKSSKVSNYNISSLALVSFLMKTAITNNVPILFLNETTVDDYLYKYQNGILIVIGSRVPSLLLSYISSINGTIEKWIKNGGTLVLLGNTENDALIDSLLNYYGATYQSSSLFNISITSDGLFYTPSITRYYSEKPLRKVALDSSGAQYIALGITSDSQYVDPVVFRIPDGSGYVFVAYRCYIDIDSYDTVSQVVIEILKNYQVFREKLYGELTVEEYTDDFLQRTINVYYSIFGAFSNISYAQLLLNGFNNSIDALSIFLASANYIYTFDDTLESYRTEYVQHIFKLLDEIDTLNESGKLQEMNASYIAELLQHIKQILEPEQMNNLTFIQLLHKTLPYVQELIEIMFNSLFSKYINLTNSSLNMLLNGSEKYPGLLKSAQQSDYYSLIINAISNNLSLAMDLISDWEFSEALELLNKTTDTISITAIYLAASTHDMILNFTNLFDGLTEISEYIDFTELTNITKIILAELQSVASTDNYTLILETVYSMVDVYVSYLKENLLPLRDDLQTLLDRFYELRDLNINQTSLHLTDELQTITASIFDDLTTGLDFLNNGTLNKASEFIYKTVSSLNEYEEKTIGMLRQKAEALKKYINDRLSGFGNQTAIFKDVDRAIGMLNVAEFYLNINNTKSAMEKIISAATILSNVYDTAKSTVTITLSPPQSTASYELTLLNMLGSQYLFVLLIINIVLALLSISIYHKRTASPIVIEELQPPIVLPSFKAKSRMARPTCPGLYSDMGINICLVHEPPIVLDESIVSETCKRPNGWPLCNYIFTSISAGVLTMPKPCPGLIMEEGKLGTSYKCSYQNEREILPKTAAVLCMIENAWKDCPYRLKVEEKLPTKRCPFLMIHEATKEMYCKVTNLMLTEAEASLLCFDKFDACELYRSQKVPIESKKGKPKVEARKTKAVSLPPTEEKIQLEEVKEKPKKVMQQKAAKKVQSELIAAEEKETLEICPYLKKNEQGNYVCDVTGNLLSDFEVTTLCKTSTYDICIAYNSKKEKSGES